MKEIKKKEKEASELNFITNKVSEFKTKLEEIDEYIKNNKKENHDKLILQHYFLDILQILSWLEAFTESIHIGKKANINVKIEIQHLYKKGDKLSSLYLSLQ